MIMETKLLVVALQLVLAMANTLVPKQSLTRSMLQEQRMQTIQRVKDMTGSWALKKSDPKAHLGRSEKPPKSALRDWSYQFWTNPWLNMVYVLGMAWNNIRALEFLGLFYLNDTQKISTLGPLYIAQRHA